jgi:hypothetical protein
MGTTRKPIKGLSAARKDGICSACAEPVVKGQVIRLWARGWAHLDCMDPWRSLRRPGAIREKAARRGENLPVAGAVAWWTGGAAPSPDAVEAGQPWDKKQLAAWGVPWPPPTGWRRELARIWRRQRVESPVVEGRPVRTLNTPPTPGGYLDRKLAEIDRRRGGMVT